MSIPPELVKMRDEIKTYAEGYGLDFFEVIFEMIEADGINALAALGGFPVRYPHWRFGMDYDQMDKGYTWGLQKIYEMVINTDPSYAYLMKSNSFVEQKTVMAHVYGHVDFFKNNTWFSKTNRKMLDTMANHAVKIRRYMDKYGQDKVEAFIDRCLAIENLIDPYMPFAQIQNSNQAQSNTQAGAQAKGQDQGSTGSGIPASSRRDPFNEPWHQDDAEESEGYSADDSGKLKVNRSYMDKFINPPDFLEDQKKKREDEAKKSRRYPSEPQKDVLAFLLENAPLEQWQNDVLRIIRDEAYYFAPQAQTKIMNEGWASYWHSKIMTEKALKDSEIIDFAIQHSGTMTMSPGRFNPYKIGIEIYRDLEERYDKGKFGKDYDDCDDMVAKSKWDKKLGLGRKKIFEVRKVYNDVTFIDEFLTDDMCEQLKLYTYGFNRRTNQYEILDRDFKKVREKILFQISNLGQPLIYVIDGNYQNKGELLLWHKHQGMDLDMKWSRETMRSLSEIWGRPVNVETQVDGQKKILTYASGEFTEKFS